MLTTIFFGILAISFFTKLFFLLLYTYNTKVNLSVLKNSCCTTILSRINYVSGHVFKMHSLYSGRHSFICFTIFYEMLVIDVTDKMLLNTLISSERFECGYNKKLFSCFSFQYQHSDSSNIFYYFIKIKHSVITFMYSI